MSDPQFSVPDNTLRLPLDEPPGRDMSDLQTQPDFIVGPPRPEPPICPPPEPPSQVSREELELALERARLVAEDCATILAPAIQAMHDGAWVSRRADEFSVELEQYARIAAEAGQGTVRVIERALEQHTDAVDPQLPVYLPQPDVELVECDGLIPEG
ncbi:hypothetical protein [Phytoactinopolyspora limicola]|uniref:hypothetical protein n=1 Tax=Phytoactinopolyspora limicola TaxID=2715536 RepID=UPI00140AF934|nr:hypothetical protein [Phytoactinopolyspora limicola]